MASHILIRYDQSGILNHVKTCVLELLALVCLFLKFPVEGIPL